MGRFKLLPLLVLALTACAGSIDAGGDGSASSGSVTEPPTAAQTARPTSSVTGPSATELPAEPTLVPTRVDPALLNRRVDDPNTYSIPRLLPVDGIAPIYDPQFVAPSEAPLLEDELVMGVAHAGEAKAYPITVLRFREIVNDEIGDWPILVTW